MSEKGKSGPEGPAFSFSDIIPTMSDTVSQIKDRLPIEEVIGNYIDIKKAGGNFKACCPFHNEKTPSFHISPDRGTYYCFGCGAKGDIFSFVQQIEGIDFKEALKNLAEKAGVEIVNTGISEKKDDDVHKKVMESAGIFFQKSLEKNQTAQDYIKSRNISDSDKETWRIGYAPDEWSALLDLFTKKEINPKILSEVGLVKKSEKGKIYDTFRNRIMFPICDANGQIIAFTGRVLKEDPNDISTQAKYLNSPETILFNKSKTLYGYHLAKNTIRKLDFSIIVEGQTDVIAMHSIGFKNAVASSGTALTEEQFKLLKRQSDNVVLALDSDIAGAKASERAWGIALSLGMNIKVAELPNGLDPADAVSKDPKIVKDAIKNSVHIIEYVAHVILNQNLTTHQQHQKVSAQIIPYLHSINSAIEQSHFVERISTMFNISRDAILQEIAGYDPKVIEKSLTYKIVPTAEIGQIKNQSLQRLVAIVEWQKLSSNKFINVDEFFEKIKEAISLDEFNSMSESIKPNLEPIIFKLESMFKDEKSLQTYVSDILENLKGQDKKKLIENLKKELQTATEERQVEIMTEIQRLTKVDNT